MKISKNKKITTIRDKKITAIIRKKNIIIEKFEKIKNKNPNNNNNETKKI